MLLQLHCRATGERITHCCVSLSFSYECVYILTHIHTPSCPPDSMGRHGRWWRWWWLLLSSRTVKEKNYTNKTLHLNVMLFPIMSVCLIQDLSIYSFISRFTFLWFLRRSGERSWASRTLSSDFSDPALVEEHLRLQLNSSASPDCRALCPVTQSQLLQRNLISVSV